MVKDYPTPYGTQWKMLMVLNNGSKLFVSVPSALMSLTGHNPRELRDKCARLTASITAKPGDNLFGYGKRPTGGEIVPCQQLTAYAVRPQDVVLPQEEI